MNVLKVVLACLHVFTSLSATGTSFEAEGEWVYIGKSVRLISFVMDTDFPGEKKSWSPGHRSGYILLDEQSFTLSSASPFDSYYFRYEKGVLARTKVSDLGVSDTETKTSKIEMDYRAALLASLDECVIQGLGNVVKEILTKNSDKAPSRLVEMTRLRATAEFGGSWQALTRVTWLLPSPDGGDSTTRVVCKFSLLIPDHVELQYRGSHSELGERACASKYLLAESLGSLVKEISAGASLGGLVQLTPYGTLLPTSEQVSIPFIYVAAYGYYYDSAERDYVRARELYKKLCRWMQVDPIWPNQKNYLYVAANPIALSDGAGLLLQKQKKVKSAVPCCSLPLNPISRLGQVYIDCNCKGVQIWVLPETGDVNKSPPCGKWLPADAIVVGKPPFQTTYKIHGQTCAYFSCPPDDENGCYAPRFEWILCRVGVAINPWLETTPTIVDFCKTFCGRPCPPACRGYLP